MTTSTPAVVSDDEMAAGVTCLVGYRGPVPNVATVTGKARMRISRSVIASAVTLAAMAAARGSAWTRDIVPKTNQPNLCYAADADRIRLSDEYDTLSSYLRPSSS